MGGLSGNDTIRVSTIRLHPVEIGLNKYKLQFGICLCGGDERFGREQLRSRMRRYSGEWVPTLPISERKPRGSPNHSRMPIAAVGVTIV
jgi:hypothetical protein